MAKPGRNDPCPCGSGNKYKKCCLAKEEAAEREELAKVEARRAESAAAHRLHLQEARAAMVAGFAAEDGYDRLGMVYEARGDHKQAAHYYQKVIDFICQHPDQYEPEFETVFRNLIERLDPSNPT